MATIAILIITTAITTIRIIIRAAACAIFSVTAIRRIVLQRHRGAVYPRQVPAQAAAVVAVPMRRCADSNMRF